ncbi:6-hydroxymethylpterin diphosphokinase MptE-like protein [Wansuia hejianensis]|uniref:DUF115 domain-containing protein n=1 Tax=Wansuia hejianensis TaxID=2763667 RepID=A0A7G9GDB5_9FIRM|nr:6-hydroxymethylpterin diphosphokinase MptE-like protein [Wansuia hejianensis]QNM08797.1 DUF115 domain-containing protein [Wansuia hejianensis]
MKNIKAFFWNNKYLKYIINVFSVLKNYYFYQMCFWLKELKGRDEKYSRIKEFKDIHIGDRCFILATGPSLTIEDVKKLKCEYTFGMNSICMLFEDLGWETTYYGVQDKGVYLKLHNSYKKLKNTTFFVGDSIDKCYREDLEHIPFAINYLDHKHSYKHLNTKFSRDLEKCIYDGYTITYSLIQLAVYMGFKEIYLLGNDCSYPSDPKKQHFMDFGHYDSSTLTARDRIIFAYEYANEYLKGTDVKIINATRGGALEVFPRIDFDTIAFKEEMI